MDFRTEIEVKPLSQEWLLSHQNKLLLLGSCFSDSMGEKLLHAGFPAIVNPFGTLYNPVSIAQSLRRLLSGELFRSEELFWANDLWNSFSHHSRFSDATSEVCLSKINTDFQAASGHLKSCDFLFLTFGSAWVYRLIENRKVVANCHKLPENRFVRERISVEEIVDVISSVLEELRKFNPKLKIVFSVSPIRHLRDGMHQNQLSKAILLLAIERLCERIEHTFYFPAYEIVLDELRDYRFFSDDMVHPSRLAIACVWEKFGVQFFDESTKQLNLRVEKLRKALQHRPFNVDTEAYLQFCENRAQQISDLKKSFGIEIM